MSTYILGIESSCDDTAAAVFRDNVMLSNVIAGQDIHRMYGGVVPEYASRAHQQNIIPVIEQCLLKAKLNKKSIDAIAFTRGPGLLGSLLVGTSFAKSMALGLGIPLIEVDHIHAHVLSHFIMEDGKEKSLPPFPFLCLVVSGGHTQIIVVKDHFNMEVIGRTIDDAAGEAFDKGAKILGLPYPGGQMIDTCSKEGDPHAFQLPAPAVGELDFSFSGLKTSFLYLVRDQLRINQHFIEENMASLCASLQYAIVNILITKLENAVRRTGINHVAVSGGVSANSALRAALMQGQSDNKWTAYITPAVYSTDNAAMVAVTGYYKFISGQFAGQDISPYTRT